MNSYLLSEIEPDSNFSADLMLDSNFMLSTPPCSISSKTIASAVKWGFTQVYTLGHVTLKQNAAKTQKTEEFQETQEVILNTDSLKRISSQTKDFSETEFNSVSEDSLALKSEVEYAQK